MTEVASPLDRVWFWILLSVPTYAALLVLMARVVGARLSVIAWLTILSGTYWLIGASWRRAALCVLVGTALAVVLRTRETAEDSLP